MKDEFYIVLPSNSSMNYFSENTTSHFITQLPQQIRLQGSWSVTLTEVQIPLTFQHVSSEALDFVDTYFTFGSRDKPDKNGKFQCDRVNGSSTTPWRRAAVF